MRGTRTLLAIALTLIIFAVALAWRPETKDDPVSRPLPALDAKTPRWLKGNLHTHSFWSDGDDFPEMISDWYKRHDYQFLGLSDHNVLSEGQRWVAVSDKMLKSKALEKYKTRFGTNWVEIRKGKDKEGKEQDQVRLKPLDEFRSTLEEAGKFLLIPSEEITGSVKNRPVHINGINLRDAIAPVKTDNVTETISTTYRAVSAQAKKTGKRTLTFLNHPNFRWGVYAEEMAAAEELRFFEVFNGHPGVANDGDESHASCEQIWDIVLTLRLGKLGYGVVYGMGTDDAHAYHSYGVGKTNPGRGWVMVRAPYLSAEAVVRAMDAGDFYASTGVVLDDVKPSREGLSLKIRGEKGVKYRTEFVATMRDAKTKGESRVGKDGKPVVGTLDYGKEIGQVVATSTDLEPTYKFTGKELYVRAKIISDKAHPNPFKMGDVETAWTQPVVTEKPQ